MGTNQSSNSFEAFCDQAIVYSLCAVIFVLPAAIAYLDSFAGLAVFFYFLKKINRMALDWPSRTSGLNPLGTLRFILTGFAPQANFLTRPLLLLTLAVFISVIFSQYPKLSLMAFMGKYLKCMFIYFSFIEAFSNEKRLKMFLGFFLLSAFIAALDGIFQHYTGRDLLKGHQMGTENFASTGRISGSFFGANGLGAYLLPVIALVTHFLYSAVSRKKSWVWVIAMALLLAQLLVCLWWTYSRSAWLGFLIILFVMVLLDRRKIFYMGALLLVFIFLFLPALSHVRHKGLIIDSSETVQKDEVVRSFVEQGGSGRFAYWKKAIEVTSTSPLWGTGLNTYTKLIKQDPDPAVWFYAHNGYLQMAAETGLIGLGCFLWMLFVLLKNGLYYCRQIKDLWPLTLLRGTVSGLCGFLVQSFFDNTFYTVQLGMLMWMLFGLVMAGTRLNEKT